MSSIVRMVARPSLKQSEIVDSLRERIVGGEFGPGCRIPQRALLEEQFRASSVTVQRALDRLVKDGFICAMGRQGTFVTETPPHLFQYGLVFPMRPEGGRPWGLCWTALRDQAVEVQKNGRRRINFYYGSERPGDHADYQDLVAAIHDRRLAGLIFASSPHNFFNTPVLDEPGIPRIGVMSQAAIPGVAAITHDSSSFISKSLDYLKSRGRSRIAAIMCDFVKPTADMISHFAAGLNERGMVFRRHWVQSLSVANPEWAANVLELMMSGNPAERPDGLLIFDDHLIEKTTVGLMSCGIRVPNDLEVVAHCNFPLQVPAAVPIKRLGYDARQVLRLAIDYIDRRRNGETPSNYVSVPALFEEELTPR